MEGTRHRCDPELTCADIFWRGIGVFHTNPSKGDNMTKKRRRGPCIPALSPCSPPTAARRLVVAEGWRVRITDRRRWVTTVQGRNYTRWGCDSSKPRATSLVGSVGYTFERFQNSELFVGLTRASQNSKERGCGSLCSTRMFPRNWRNLRHGPGT